MAPCNWANGGSVDVFFTWWVWFYLWGLDAILGSECGIEGQHFVALLQASKMYAESRYRDMIFVA